jgi:nicotinamide-nucleotide amidase
MRLELINTGTELLLGHTLNTHLTWLGERLMPFGLRIARQIAIPDGEIIREALLESFRRCDIVIATGGLGPTSDDITREISAELLGLPLREDPAIIEKIRTYLSRRGRESNEHTRRQAQVPQGAVVLANDFGTAPGLYFPPVAVAALDGAHSPHLFLLPGPPRELKPMFEIQAAPILRGICQGKTHVAQMRNFRISGVGESDVARTVEPALRSIGEDLEIGYCARPAEVIVRCIGTAQQLEAARMVVAAAFPEEFFSDDDSNIETTLIGLLRKLGKSVATAESCTGGQIAHRLTNVPGASAVFLEGMVTYSNAAKSALLGVPAPLLEAHGAVSHEVCQAMAEGCVARAGTNFAVAVTGIAGPDGGTPEKPVGTVFIGVASSDARPTLVERHLFPFEREMFKQITSETALNLVRQRVMGIARPSGKS